MIRKIGRTSLRSSYRSRPRRLVLGETRNSTHSSFFFFFLPTLQNRGKYRHIPNTKKSWYLCRSTEYQQSQNERRRGAWAITNMDMPSGIATYGIGWYRVLYAEYSGSKRAYAGLWICRFSRMYDKWLKVSFRLSNTHLT